jgi:hypothetical protein
MESTYQALTMFRSPCRECEPGRRRNNQEEQQQVGTEKDLTHMALPPQYVFKILKPPRSALPRLQGTQVLYPVNAKQICKHQTNLLSY